jgi:nucleotide-binding universal stress UspA family protein
MAVVCGTDFSPLSQFAAEVAAELAAKTHQELILVYTADRDSSSQDAQRQLATTAEKIRQSGATVIERFETGVADERIAAIAADASASLILIGATGAAHPSSLLGGTADRVASRVSLPLFLVRENFPIREWTKAQRTLRVTVAADLAPISNDAIAWAQQMTQYGPCTYTLAHVEWLPETYERINIEGPLPLDRTHPAVEKAIRRDLEATARILRTSGPCDIVIEAPSGHPASDLERVSRQSNGDAIVVGHQPRRSWSVWEQSVARALMRTSSTSVICVPASETAVRAVRPHYKSVVVATDLSPDGNTAVAHAFSIVEKGGRVTIIHALDAADANHEARQRSEEALRQVAASANKQGDIEVNVEVVEGEDRAEAICMAADRAHADVLCIASGGRSQLPRIVFGAIAQEVLLLSRSAVLVVRSQPGGRS